MKGVGSAGWGGTEQKGFPNNFPLQRGGNTDHKSCLQWVLCVALFLKIFFFRKPLSGLLFFVREGVRRKKGVRGRGEEGGGPETPGNLTSKTFFPFW